MPLFSSCRVLCGTERMSRKTHPKLCNEVWTHNMGRSSLYLSLSLKQREFKGATCTSHSPGCQGRPTSVVPPPSGAPAAAGWTTACPAPSASNTCTVRTTQNTISGTNKHLFQPKNKWLILTPNNSTLKRVSLITYSLDNEVYIFLHHNSHTEF